MPHKARVLLVGGGGIGTIAALNLEHGGLAEVTAVLRSNFDIVSRKGFSISSCDHGTLENWRPARGQSAVLRRRLFRDGRRSAMYPTLTSLQS